MRLDLHRIAARTTPSATAAVLAAALLFSAIGLFVIAAGAGAATTVFFDSSQLATPVASGVTSDTVSSNGYLFTYTRDKLFTGGIGMTEPIGRPVRVQWPEGVEAQAVTVPPPGVTDYKARIVVQRVDGGVFDLMSFTARLLANTFGTGASIEIMPKLNGEDAFNNPLYFDASGSAGNSFSYDATPNPLGSTAPLKGFDTYSITLFVDFAITALALEGPPVVPGPLPPALMSAVSRKQHSVATRDLALNLSPTDPTTEPRAGASGGSHTIAFVFDKPVTSGTAVVTGGTGTAGAATFNGNEMIVPLTGVANQQYLTVTVSDVVAVDGGTGGSGSVRVGFLLGDVSQNRVVTVSDLAQVNAQIAQAVTAANFLKDVNASGTLTVADKGIANTQITKGLPAP